jgi:hypothetical protein
LSVKHIAFKPITNIRQVYSPKLSIYSMSTILVQSSLKMERPSLDNKSRSEHQPKHFTCSKPTLTLNNAKSCPTEPYVDELKQFEAFSGEWIDSKGQTVLISAWGVIRYPSIPKLRFEAKYIGPNLLSVTFERDPLRREFVARLNHECSLLIWSNDSQWARKGSKYVLASSPASSAKTTTHKKRAIGNQKIAKILNHAWVSALQKTRSKINHKS